MAIPTSLFTNRWGLALMRYDHSNGEWFFLTWVSKSIFIDDVSPGTYTYQIWLVVGGNASGITGVTINGWSRIVALQAAR